MVPPVFKEMSGWKVARPQDHVSRGKWWELYGDSYLNGLAEQVAVSNQTLAAADAQYRQALALVQAARAAYFPTVTAGASFTRSFRSVNSVGSTASGKTTSDFLLPLNASWEPDLWGKVRRSVEAGRTSAQASAADLEAVRLSLQSELAQDYFQLRTLDAQKKLLDLTTAAFRKSLELTVNRYESGVASRADVLQAETQLKSTEAQAIDTRVQRAQLEHAIAALVGSPASAFSISFMPLNALPPEIPVGLPSELLERRPDIAAAERRIASANAQIGAAEAAYYPTLTLTASAGFEASDLSHWLSWPSRFWSFGPAITETLYDGGLRGAQTDQARAVYDASVATYRQTVLTGFQEVEDNLAALRILEQEARVQGEAVTSARQSVAVTTNQYRAGTVSYLDVIVTQAALLVNERTAIDILGRRMTASVLLIKALGGGWNISALPSEDDVSRRGGTKGH
jgi:NodT family efflux transporter outer membrane factor (OMF) lipoprotein